jgi:membrane protein YqaA with SNARE-associated domain
VFLSAFLGSATVVFPGFNPFLVFFNAIHLNPFLLAIAAGTGWGLGEGTGYLIGFFGPGAIRFMGGHLFEKVKKDIDRGQIALKRGLKFTLRPILSEKICDQIDQFSFKRSGFLVLFIATLFPNPFIEAFTIPAGAIKYPWYKFVIATVSGRIILSLVLIAIARKTL